MEDSEASVFTDFGSLSSSGASTEEPSRQPTLSLPVCSFALKISRGMMYHYLFLFFSSAEEEKGVVEEEEDEEGNRI